MAVGAVGGISTAMMSPYVYNSRTVSSASLDAVSRISDDATDGGVDFTSDKEKQVNVNPLKKGETNGFADILMSQLYSGAVKQMNAFSSPAAENQTQTSNQFSFGKMLAAYGIE